MYVKLIKHVVLLSLLLTILPVNAAVLPVVGDADSSESVQMPDGLAQSQVGDFVAPLDEQQVRQLLIEKLAADASQNQATDEIETISVIEMLKGINNPYTPLGGAVIAIINSANSFFSSITEIISKLTGGNGWLGFFMLIGILAIVAVLACLVEYVCLLRPRKALLSQQLNEENTVRNRLGKPLIVFVMNFCGLVIFAIAGYILAAFIKPEDSTEYQVMMQMFDWIITIRFFVLLFSLLFKQWPKGLGLIDDEVSISKLHNCMVMFTIFYVVGTGFVHLLVANGLSNEHMILYLAGMAGLVLNPVVLWFVWSERYQIDRSLFGEVDESICKVNGYRYAARAAIWPTVVTVLITFGLFNWVIQLLLKNQLGIKAITIAWWITLLFPVIDLLVTSLLHRLTSLDVFQHHRFQQRKQRFIFIIRNVVRLMLITVLILSILRAWGFDLIAEYRTIGGRDIVVTLIDIGAVVLIGYIIWEAIQLWMERKLPDEPDEGELEIEGEGGGAAATRTETLLPLFKTTLLIVLFLMVVMSILYSLGIQIGPLLAGAGVVGIAVGFGAQKLVQDIISGVFFLIDDAFRKGEYVEVAGMRGTVEKLSVRSMRLRHHLGSVQTIPYGEIATVKNQSRDWVIMKLELRLPYDVDIEKVRKIIKKVGQQMMEDEEIGPNMLQPLKSQGVMRVEESALIIRMKFTAKPGEQWIVRRVAYTKVRDALAAAGIEFAHREVKVRLPQELEHLQKMDYERKLHKDSHKDSDDDSSESDEVSAGPAAIAAAAMSAVVAKELERQQKIDDDMGSDDDR